MAPVVVPFAVGLVTAPLMKRVAAPLIRGVIKTSVSVAMEVKRAAQQAGEELHDLAAEVSAEMFAADLAEAEPVPVPMPAKAGGVPKTPRAK